MKGLSDIHLFSRQDLMINGNPILNKVSDKLNFKEIAQQIAEEILKHKDYFKVTDTGYGYRYDLSIVKIE